MKTKSIHFITAFEKEVEKLENLPSHIVDNMIKPIPIHNLDEEEIRLDFDTHQTLAYGLKFAPQPRKFPSNEMVLKHFGEFKYNMMNKYSAFVESWKPRKKNDFGLKLKLQTKVKVKRVDPRHGIIMNFCADVLDDIASNLDEYRKANPESDREGYKNMSNRHTKKLLQLKDAKCGIIKPSDKNMGPSISTK
jgi:hypothetical protein